MRLALAAICSAAVLLLCATPAHANAPAPWWACNGKTVGEACERYGGADGVCARQPECTDSRETEVDECLYCKTSGNGCSAGSGGLAGGGALLLAAAFLVRRRCFSAAVSAAPARARAG